VLAVGAAALLVRGCDPEGGELRTARRIPLPGSVAAGATLAVDRAGRAWVGEAGRLTALDSTGRVTARLPAGGGRAPRLLWWDDGGLAAATPDGVALIDPRTGRTVASRRSAAPVARDPRGGWVYTATRGGGVLGLTADSLRPRWGWPDAGSPAGALAVSPLGDRVYVALEGSAPGGVEPAVQVRDAQSGRVLSELSTAAWVRVLEPGRGDTLFALVAGDVAALRHGPEGLVRLWSAGLVGLGVRRAEELRVSPAGGRIAVLARERGLRVLDAATGAVVAGTDEAPRDAAFDVGGRLWLLYPREIRIVR